MKPLVAELSEPEPAAELSSTDAPSVAKPRESLAKRDTPGPPRTAVGKASSSRAMPLSVELVYYQAAVRARMVDITPDHVEFALVEVIFGIDPGEVFRAPCIPNADGARRSLRNAPRFDGTTGPREPSEDEVREHVVEMNQFEKGREVVVLLQEGRRTAVNPVYEWRGAWTGPHRPPADQRQKKVFEIIKAGSHMTPPDHPADLAIYVQFSKRIVRARLLSVGEESMQWELTGKIYHRRSQPRPDTAAEQSNQAAAVAAGETITVSLEPWRIRADAIARHGTKPQPGQAPPDEAVRRELSRLLERELHEGRQAVLFLGRVGRGAKDGGPVELIGIVHEDPDKPQYIDRFEETVARLIERGGHLGTAY